MGFIWLTEVVNKKEREICINLDKIVKIYQEESRSNIKYYRIFLSSNDNNDNNGILIKDNHNHLTNTLFKNKAQE